MEEDFSKVTARDLLLKINIKQNELEKEQTRQNTAFEKFRDNDHKSTVDKVDDLIRWRSEHVGVWKTITGISVLLGILATLLALYK